MDRLFTPEQAEQLLPVLIPMLERLRTVSEELNARQRELVGLHWKARGNGKESSDDALESKQAECDEIQRQMQRALQEIQAHGVEVKDAQIGLVDFPCQRGDRVVYLCWKLGEQGIRYWHELDEGYAGRQPL